MMATGSDGRWEARVMPHPLSGNASTNATPADAAPKSLIAGVDYNPVLPATTVTLWPMAVS